MNVDDAIKLARAFATSHESDRVGKLLMTFQMTESYLKKILLPHDRPSTDEERQSYSWFRDNQLNRWIIHFEDVNPYGLDDPIIVIVDDETEQCEFSVTM